MISRHALLQHIDSARRAGQDASLRAAAAAWLASWPGDLEVRLALAQVELQAGASEKAVEHATQILAADPERVVAYRLMAQALPEIGDHLRAPIYQACVQILGGSAPDPLNSPGWAPSLHRALELLKLDEPEEAVLAAREALGADPSLPLPTVVAVRAHLANADSRQAISLATDAHDRWPECLLFRLILARSWIDSGQAAKGVRYLHQIAADDPMDLVSSHVLGSDHPYRSLWPSQPEAEVADVEPAPAHKRPAFLVGDPPVESDHPTPKEAAASPPPVEASANQPVEDELPPELAAPVQDLPDPEPWEAFQGPSPSEEQQAPETESLIDIRREFDRLAERLNANPLQDETGGRLPAYVVLSSHTRLVQEFGEGHFRAIDAAAMALVEAVRRRKRWVGYRLYLDDPRSLKPFGIAPCDPGNAWQIKLRLADFDRALAQRGEMIAAVLIVGGHRIVPFHMLPNPTDDDDDFVPSDNPYATSDDNYFAPEWAVGRLPIDKSPELLVQLIKAAAQQHRQSQYESRISSRFPIWFRGRFGRLWRRSAGAVGYSASIWRKASMAVFKSIGAPRSLITSPPVMAGSIPESASRPVGLSYYNLHGLEDAPEWFGQRDPLRDRSSATEFPIALRPEDVINSGRAPKVVFTEACYGANALDKTPETAICLKFLASGSRAVVGSTKISYGSIGTPLIAADLIGQLFWEQLREPLPVGEAFRRARLAFAAEMHSRQGFLDGEDQKTLISFVLYGDPLYTPQGVTLPAAAKLMTRSAQRPKQVKTACALGGPDLLQSAADPVAAQRVRSIVAQYLPGMADAICHVRYQHAGCQDGDHICPSQQVGVKSLGPGGLRETTVVTFAKHVDEGARRHPHYARLTLDEGGKVLKLAVSR